MARHGRERGPRRPMKGFRPGKEPPELRKRRAKEQFGDVNATQEHLIALFAERTPEESRGLLRRWRVGLMTGAVVLGVLAALLLTWSLIAAVIAGIFAGVLLFLWWRLHRQREALEAMADAVAGTGGRRRKR